MKNIRIIIAAVFSLYACIRQPTPVAEIRTVKTDTVYAVNRQQQAVFPGKVRASYDVDLAFKVSGTIQKIAVAEGAYVKKGQVLAEIDPRDYHVQLSATEAEYYRVKAEADRVMALYNKGSATPNDYDKAVYGLHQITAKYDAHKNALADTRLLAPFDGFVQKKLFHTNETIGAGMPVISMIYSGSSEVEINIPAGDFIRRSRFESFDCAIDFYPGKSFPLDLIGVTRKANLNQLYAMRLKIRDTGGELPAPGMSTMVTIHYKTDETGMTAVPITALFGESGESAVWVYDAETGTICSRTVKLREILTDGTVIISEGLQAGELVVSAGVHSLQQGDKVAPLPPPSSTNIGGEL
ncbi:MAG: efflux RND transporter periplasmic adaptor subunit [Bacteroidales bacterium]|jgi:RND family efflux transporter MFP subunit|nr:efflux RND transporter periplasmic adaptor subunit [Bacteroidales bacterium]